MSCGNLFLQDPVGRFWVLSSDDTGVLVSSLSSMAQPNFIAPVLRSASLYWQLSAGLDGLPIATAIAPTTAGSSFLLSSTRGGAFQLTIDDTGVLATAFQGALSPFQIPYPTDVSMSVFPNLGLTSTVAGATPLTVSADFSIWSCTLNQFINEDTTNIIVVLDE